MLADITFWGKLLLVASFMVRMVPGHGELQHGFKVSTFKETAKKLTKKLPHSHISVDYRHGNENIPDAKQLPCNWENAHDQSLCDILRTLCRKVHFILKIVEREKKGGQNDIFHANHPSVFLSITVSYYNRGEKSYTISCSFDRIWKFTHLQFLILLIALENFTCPRHFCLRQPHPWGHASSFYIQGIS